MYPAAAPSASKVATGAPARPPACTVSSRSTPDASANSSSTRLLPAVVLSTPLPPPPLPTPARAEACVAVWSPAAPAASALDSGSNAESGPSSVSGRVPLRRHSSWNTCIRSARVCVSTACGAITRHPAAAPTASAVVSNAASWPSSPSASCKLKCDRLPRLCGLTREPWNLSPELTRPGDASDSGVLPHHQQLCTSYHWSYCRTAGVSTA